MATWLGICLKLREVEALPRELWRRGMSESRGRRFRVILGVGERILGPGFPDPCTEGRVLGVGGKIFQVEEV